MPSNNPPLIDAAGGLVVDPSDALLFIFKDGKWDLPKGIVDKGASAAKTALAEIVEETGIAFSSLEIERKLIPTHNISKYQKIRYTKRTMWFQVRCSVLSTSFKPQTEEGIEHCEWIPVWELDKVFANCPDRVAYLLKYWLKFRRHFG